MRMPLSVDRIDVDTRSYLGIAEPVRVTGRLAIEVADRAYLPHPDDPQQDWIASVAAPAFKVLRAERGSAFASFCSIGTGAGLDALAAVELLGVDTVGVTDLFPDVVTTAVGNLRRNLVNPSALTVLAGAGDLLEPLRLHGARFGIVFENLPNLPLEEGRALDEARTSGAFVGQRDETVPGFIGDWLMTLHYLALVQAREALDVDGMVIATLAGRSPLGVFIDMAAEAGYRSDFVTFGWKVQAVADEVISSYAAWEQRGRGPFVFYPAAVLESAFAGLDPALAGEQALAIEADLHPYALDAVGAWERYQMGERIGHTVAALRAARRFAP
jgi:hypothetical protein